MHNPTIHLKSIAKRANQNSVGIMTIFLDTRWTVLGHSVGIGAKPATEKSGSVFQALFRWLNLDGIFIGVNGG